MDFVACPGPGPATGRRAASPTPRRPAGRVLCRPSWPASPPPAWTPGPRGEGRGGVGRGPQRPGARARHVRLQGGAEEVGRPLRDMGQPGHRTYLAPGRRVWAPLLVLRTTNLLPSPPGCLEGSNSRAFWEGWEGWELGGPRDVAVPAVPPPGRPRPPRKPAPTPPIRDRKSRCLPVDGQLVCTGGSVGVVASRGAGRGPGGPTGPQPPAKSGPAPIRSRLAVYGAKRR